MFRVRNTKAGKRVTFNIRNFTKPFSLHKQGMRVMHKSERASEKIERSEEEHQWDIGWTPEKEEAQYTRSNVVRSGWRIPGPLNLDDEEDDDQVLDDINGVDGSAALGNQKAKKPTIPAGSALQIGKD